MLELALTQSPNHQIDVSHQHLGNQDPYAINEGYCEDAFGCLVFVRVHVISEEGDIGYKAPNTKEGYEFLFWNEVVGKFIQAKAGESEKINKDEYQQGQKEPQYESQLQIVPVKKKCPSVFQAVLLVYSELNQIVRVLHSHSY